MTAGLLLASYAVLIGGMAAMHAAGRLTGRVPTLGALLRRVAGHPAGRCVLVASWLWLGWHLFVRSHH